MRVPWSHAQVAPHSGTGEGPVTALDVQRAAELISGRVRNTPMLPAGELSRGLAPPWPEGRVPAAHWLVQDPRRLQRDRAASPGSARPGVCAASAGNHAQAVALAADQARRRAEVFMPVARRSRRWPRFAATAATVRLVEGVLRARPRSAAAGVAEARGMTLVHPSTTPTSSPAQGTVGLEIARQAPATRLIVVPLGGGGPGGRDRDRASSRAYPGRGW